METLRHRTLGDLLEYYFAGLRPSSAEAYRPCLRHAAGLMGVKLSRITPDRIQALYAGLSPATAYRLHRILHRAFTLAMRQGWMKANPCDKVVAPKYKPARQPLWTAEQLRTFLRATRGHWAYPLFVLLAGTGMPLGEALALRWEDVDLQRGVATVAASLAWVGGRPLLQELSAGRRAIALPAPVVAALQEHRASRSAGEEWVFPAPRTGGPLRQTTVAWLMREICGRLGLPPLSPRGLRYLRAALPAALGPA